MQVGFELWMEYIDARRVEADGACRDELSTQLHLVQRKLADETEVRWGEFVFPSAVMLSDRMLHNPRI